MRAADEDLPVGWDHRPAAARDHGPKLQEMANSYLPLAQSRHYGEQLLGDANHDALAF